jgi:hypothetical protein
MKTTFFVHMEPSVIQNILETIGFRVWQRNNGTVSFARQNLEAAVHITPTDAEPSEYMSAAVKIEVEAASYLSRLSDQFRAVTAATTVLIESLI